MTPLHRRMQDAMTVRGLAERSALEQPCTLRGRLGLHRTVPVRGGADATPDRAIGQFADANWVSIPWRCGS